MCKENYLENRINKTSLMRYGYGLVPKPSPHEEEKVWE